MLNPGDPHTRSPADSDMLNALNRRGGPGGPAFYLGSRAGLCPNPETCGEATRATRMRGIAKE
ncbi:C6 transcription factor [Penicillium sp. IBT 35674x]|nr:C6 transcription factor [Penicillium sp. IBT 35674x]